MSGTLRYIGIHTPGRKDVLVRTVHVSEVVLRKYPMFHTCTKHKNNGFGRLVWHFHDEAKRVPDEWTEAGD